MSVPSAKEKENLVIDLLKKGYKTREITKLAHVSNTTVKKIRARLTAEAKEEQEHKATKRKNHCPFHHRHSTFFKRASPLSRLPLGLI
jgi:transposase